MQHPYWLVDGHVHFHRLGSVAPTLDAAASNFRSINAVPERLLGAILLTQTAAERVFESLESMDQAGGWALSAADSEPETLVARNENCSLAVICGRQVRTTDGLEILALGTRSTFSDGLPFAHAVEAVRRSGALPVVPWGFGKWLGDRGRQVLTTLESLGPESVFIGDNGSRLAMWGMPSQLRNLELRGFRLLPGTDPFPFARDYRRVGRFGFVVDATLSENSPWRTLRNWLVSQRTSPRCYGRALGPANFLFRQVGSQVYRRLARHSSR